MKQDGHKRKRSAELFMLNWWGVFYDLIAISVLLRYVNNEVVFTKAIIKNIVAFFHRVAFR